MPVLSHSVNYFKLLNLGYLRGGRGPYAIRQDGYPPGSTTMEDHRYILMEDGSWMLNYAFYLLPEEEQEKALFGSIARVFEAIDDLAGKDLVVHSELPEGANKQSILAAMRDTGHRVAQRIDEAKAGVLKR